jgi:P4 family phage/plasmid primase-like protien
MSSTPTVQSDTAAGDPPATPPPASPPLEFEPQHLERLRIRAIDPDLAYREGARSLTQDQIRAFAANPKLVGTGLGYSYGHLGPPNTECTCYVRIYIDDIEANGRKAVVRAGITPPPYFLSTAIDHQGPWLITESPEKALSLKSQGFDEPVGLGGVDTGFLTAAADGPRALQPLVRHFIKSGHTVYLVMDAGRVVNARVARAEARIARALIDYGCSVQLVELPLRDGGDDQGVDDFLFEHGRADLEKLVGSAVIADPLERTEGARTADGARALVSDLPFVAAVDEATAETGAAITAAIEPLVGKGALERALAEYRTKLRRAAILDRGDEVELGHRLVDDLGGKDDLLYDQGSLYHYENGIWSPVDRTKAVRIVAGYAGAMVRGQKGLVPLRLSERAIAGAVKLAGAEVARAEFFDEAPRCVVFSNCVLRVRDTNLVTEMHSREHRARYRYDFPYKPGMPAPRFHQFLSTVWQGDPDAKEKALVVQEYAGASLFGLAARTKKILLLHGEGDSGKSTTINIISGVFPPGSVASVPPQQFRSDYHRAALAGALLNVVSEVPETEWMDPAPFKALTGDDLVSARSPYHAVFQFRPVAGHMFGANIAPRINDRSAAAWNRLILISFNRMFVSVGDGRTGPSAHKGLAEIIITEEQAGVITWAVAGLRRLLAQGLSYTALRSSQLAVDALRTQSDQLSTFFEEQCVVDPNGRCEVRLLHQRYMLWARATNHQVMSSTTFGREFVPLLRRMTGQPDPRSTNHAGHRVYVGIRLQALTVNETPKALGNKDWLDGPYPLTIEQRESSTAADIADGDSVDKVYDGLGDLQGPRGQA